jgi:hypothetical protein
MNRISCVICSGNLVHLYTLENIPISFSPPINDYSTDIYSNQEYYYCEKCGCVQIGNLIDPDILYKNAHNITFNTPTWNKHHIEFSNFVLDKVKDEDTITEIGGMSGILSSHILKARPDIKYTCMDICDISDELPGVVFKQGNCEDYNFEGTKTITLSHVFEHLYNPSKFVENISKSNVNSVILSIPNLEELLNNKNINSLHFEHTYYVDKSYIEWLFSKNGYILNTMHLFGKHSLFLHFIKKEHTPIELYNNTILKNKFLELLSIRNKIASTKIEPNSFIIPAGHFGQQIYTLCKPGTLLGFIDNDTSKQSFRVYGTPYTVYPFSKLNEYDNVNVYVYAGPYTNELKEQLKSYKVNIIEFT